MGEGGSDEEESGGGRERGLAPSSLLIYVSFRIYFIYPFTRKIYVNNTTYDPPNDVEFLLYVRVGYI